jgi:hypothetical protein
MTYRQPTGTGPAGDSTIRCFDERSATEAQIQRAAELCLRSDGFALIPGPRCLSRWKRVPAVSRSLPRCGPCA